MSPRSSRAIDILPTPRSSLPRYAAYVRARHRFWDHFPSGAYTRVPTPGTDLECGFYALIISMELQLDYVLSSSSSSSSSSEQQQTTQSSEGLRQRIRVPTTKELREVYASSAVREENERVGMGNGSWFTADQLAAVFAEWGRKFLNVVEEEEEEDGTAGDEATAGGTKIRCQMGWVMDRDEEVGVEGWPVMMNTPDVDTGETGEGIVRVWVWNDGGSLRGGVGHFEGLRRVTVEEGEAMGLGRGE
ncbi:uncharacterized protein C8A04DRAFT_29979 [Dichotomopilus funicola]|uniref:Uncharacterized protein n=1 Tax=Dichotomopilus funicola TaxID=1934379 RepID=A0AAN6UZZ3_9PEZI|nr:hypothetical protein C8A04DRAFT_29979 [Dichotomopilus funicola]